MTILDETPPPWQLADLGAMVRAAATRGSFAANRSYVVAAELDGAVRDMRTLSRAAEVATDAWTIGRRFIGPAAAQMIPRDAPSPPDVVVHLVRCRNARAVWGAHELTWAYGLLYGLNLITAFCGDVIVLTPCGWTTGGMSGAAAPTLTELA